MKEMINSYKHADQYVKLKGRQIDVGKEGMARIFGLSCEKIVPIRKESYNPIVAAYFIGYEHEHYIPCLMTRPQVPCVTQKGSKKLDLRKWSETWCRSQLLTLRGVEGLCWKLRD